MVKLLCPLELHISKSITNKILYGNAIIDKEVASMQASKQASKRLLFDAYS